MIFSVNFDLEKVRISKNFGIEIFRSKIDLRGYSDYYSSIFIRKCRQFFIVKTNKKVRINNLRTFYISNISIFLLCPHLPFFLMVFEKLLHFLNCNPQLYLILLYYCLDLVT